MRLGKQLLAVALLTSSVALIWPSLFSQYLPSSFRLSSDANRRTCPFGFGSGVPMVPIRQLGNATHVYLNAHIWTANPKAPRAEALAVNANTGRIVAVGREAHVMRVVPPDVQRVDLGGKWVVPGFVDAHVHYISGGLMLRQLDLSHATSKEEFVAAVKLAVSEGKTHNGWLLGFGWDQEKMGGEMPHREWIDEATPGLAALLTRMDGHMALANTVALKRARAWPDPPEYDTDCGEVQEDEEGQLTGILIEACAMNIVTKHVPEWSIEDRVRAAKEAGQYALARGVTSVADMGRYPWDVDGSQPWADLEQVYDKLAEEGQLKTRIHAFIPMETWPRLKTRIDTKGRRHRLGRLQWGAIKDFADGSLGSRTALLIEPYTDDNSTQGTHVQPWGNLRREVEGASWYDLQCAIHAIGDRALFDTAFVYTSLPTLEGAQEPTAAVLRHRIEHAQHMSPYKSTPPVTQILAREGIYVVTNPLHLLSDVGMLTKRLGAERAGPGRSFAFNTFLQAGVKQSFGSDWPVVPMDAVGGMYAAVARRSPGQPASTAWAPEECITGEEALYAHTQWAAEACWMDDKVGSFHPGMMADFVVLSGSPLLRFEDAQPSSVLATYLDGICEYGCSNVGDSAS